jgi:hypothetical protein
MPNVTIKFTENFDVSDELRPAWEAYTQEKFTKKAFAEWYIMYATTDMECILADVLDEYEACQKEKLEEG